MVTARELRSAPSETKWSDKKHGCTWPNTMRSGNLWACSARWSSPMEPSGTWHADTAQTYLQYLMLHACLCTVCFVFCYTSCCFYAFFRTNPLTRCHSVSSLFSAIFVFQKSYKGNILGIGWNKSRSSCFFRHETESKAETGEPGASHTIGRRGQPLARATRWWGHLAHNLTPPFRLYILLDGKTLSRPINFLENILQAAAVIYARSGGCRSSSRHPTGEGNHHRRPSSSPCLLPKWCVSSLPWTTDP
jgi:hypothetical protein